VSDFRPDREGRHKSGIPDEHFWPAIERIIPLLSLSLRLPPPTHSSLRLQEPNISLAYRVGSSFVLNLPCPPDANQHTWLGWGSNREGRLTEQSPQSERFAIKEFLALNGHVYLYAGRDQATCALFKIDAGKRLIDLQRPPFSGLRIEKWTKTGRNSETDYSLSR
jgi:hypothetical protein